jgi:hypothetical protein
VDLNQNYTSLDDSALADYAAEVRAAFDALAELDSPTAEQITEAEALADHLEKVFDEQHTREVAAQELADRASALKERFKDQDSETEPEQEPGEEDDDGDEEPGSAEDAPSGDVVEGEVIEVVDEPAAARSNVVTLSRKVKRPPKPGPSRNPVVITAAADVPEFATGSKIDHIDGVGQAALNRMRGFGTPSGDGKTENLQHYGVASFRIDFPENLTIDRHSDDMEVLEFARKETRLPGKSLTAAGGWCAPSETIYDLCPGETVEGILSISEVNVKRGGLKYTSGPDFAAIYAAPSFCMTEAQAIAGSVTKTCIDVPCPAFTEVRLDACGLCIKVPLLTQAAYPELIQRWISGSLVAFQHKMNARVLAAMATGSGPARVFAGLGATSTDTLEAVELVIMQQRQKYRLGLSATLEVVVPLWVKGAVRADLARRNGCCGDGVSDADINAVFSNAGANVQFVYDWQELDTTAEVYPATFNALVYPAGTWIKGTSDVINLNAVYDAASLATNTYTALFMEQGLLVAKMCYESNLITLPVCNAGRTGAANLTCAGP